MGWIAKSVTFIQNRSSMQAERTCRQRGPEDGEAKYAPPFLDFSENVLTKRSGVADNRPTSAWQSWMRLGQSTETDDHVVGAAAGIVKARAAMGRPSELQWNKRGHSGGGSAGCFASACDGRA